MASGLEIQLAQALRAGDFDAANSLAAQYGQSALTALRAAPPAEREAVLGEALQVLNDSLHLAQVLRAHIATQWRANSGTFLYQSSDSERHLWQLEA